MKQYPKIVCALTIVAALLAACNNGSHTDAHLTTKDTTVNNIDHTGNGTATDTPKAAPSNNLTDTAPMHHSQ